MTIRIAINGFGRIGRCVLRALHERKNHPELNQLGDIEVVAINDLSPKESLQHLLSFDSVHGRFTATTVEAHADGISVGGKPILITAEADPTKLPWGKLNIDIVFECTGRFTEKEKAMAHIKAGAKKVMISAPATDADKTIVYGVNHHTLTKNDTIISNASCTTNCLVPIAQVLHRELGIEHGLMTTIHAYTNDQNLHDAPHKDLRRARAGALSMIPSTTGAAKAVGLVLPELAGKLDGLSIRIPTPNVSLVDLTFTAGKSASVDDINALIKNAAKNYPVKGVLDYTDQPLVSVDFNHSVFSSTFDATQTRIIKGSNLVKVMSWYDNEWGFSNRMLDLAQVFGKL